MVLADTKRGLRGGGRRLSRGCERGILPSARVVRLLLCGDSERVVPAGDHGLVNEILGDGDRGELTADQTPDAIGGEGDDSSYLSSRFASDEYSLAESLMFKGLGKILLKGGRSEGVSGVGGVDMPEDGPDAARSSISRYS